MPQKTIQDWLVDPGLYATNALAILTDKFGTEFLEWDPATLEMEVSDTLGVQMTSTLSDRVQAASALFTSNIFWLSLESFAAICNALNMGVTTSEVFLPPDLDDVLWGITEANILVGDDAAGEKFSHNVSRYVGTLLKEAGVTRPPQALLFAEYPEQDEINAQDSWEEDELLYRAYYDNQETSRAELESDNNVQIMLLFRQLQQLPLTAGSTEFIDAVFSRVNARPSNQ